MRSCRRYKKTLIRGVLNGHIGKGIRESEKFNGGWSFGKKNVIGKKIVEILVAYDLGIMNTRSLRREMSIL